MRLHTIEIRNFRRLRCGEVKLGPGINVLYGPNDLGKSTIAEAVRAAFLVQMTSNEAKKFVPWNSDLVPFVRLVFDVDGRTYQLTKTFTGVAATAKLEESAGGVFVTKAEGRLAEDSARKMLGWGLPALGGRGRQSSETWLTVALLGRQDEVARILETDLAKDPSGSGREAITNALGAMSRDPRVERLIIKLKETLASVFTEQGNLRQAENSPLVAARRRIKQQEELLSMLDAQRQNSERVERDIMTFSERRDKIALARDEAKRKLADVIAAEDLAKRHADLSLEVERWTKDMVRIQAAESEIAALDEKIADIDCRLIEVRECALSAREQEVCTEADMNAARGSFDEAKVQLERGKAAEAENKARRRLEIESAIATAKQRMKEAEECRAALRHAEECKSNYETANAKAEEQEMQVLQLTADVEQAIKQAHELAQKKAYIAVVAGIVRVGSAKRGLQEADAAFRKTEEALRNGQRNVSPDVANELQRTVTRLVRVESEERKAKEWLRDAAEVRQRISVAEALKNEVVNLERRFEATNQTLQLVEPELKGLQNNPASVLKPSAIDSVNAAEKLSVSVSPLSPALVALSATLVAGASMFLISRNVAWSLVFSVLGAMAGYAARRWSLRTRVVKFRRESLQKEQARLEQESQAQAAELRRQRDAVQRAIVDPPAGFDGDPVKDVPVWEERRTAASKERAELEVLISDLESRTADETRRADENIAKLRADHERNIEYARHAQESLSSAREFLAEKRAMLDTVVKQPTPNLETIGPSMMVTNSGLLVARKKLEECRIRANTLRVVLEQAQDAAARPRSVSAGAEDAVIAMAVADTQKAEADLAGLETTSSLEGLEQSFQSAREVLEGATGRFELRKGERTKFETELASLERERDNRRVERDTKHLALQTHDKAECERLLSTAKSELAGLPPLGDRRSVSRTVAEMQLQNREEELRQADEALHSQQGQLQLLGGAVIAERCEMEREVLERLKVEAANLEEEMEALRLLLDTLKQQDSARSSNLGAVLSRPVSERFVALAGPRYKQVAIDVGLTSAGVVAAGERRDLADLSLGTKEQLAVLFRVVVASELKTALLLDDQLVQSDPNRLRWFLDEFRRCADGGTQIVILTCRPEDYLSGLQIEKDSAIGASVNIVDLSQCVTCE